MQGVDKFAFMSIINSIDGKEVTERLPCPFFVIIQRREVIL